jgi:hypothetical protein
MTMAPAYRFDFRGGISSRSVVDRHANSVDRDILRPLQPISFWLDDTAIGSSFGRNLSAGITDLLDLAVAVYIADRLAVRETLDDHRDPGDRWHRRMEVVVPVRIDKFWRSTEVESLLRELLHFLTDDYWSFQFVARTHERRAVESQQCLTVVGLPTTAVILQSDGLDSLFGVDLLLRRSKVSLVAPVTIVTNPRLRIRMTNITREVRKAHFPPMSNLSSIRVGIGISGKGRPRDDKESSQRARGFLYLAAGVAAASAANIDSLYVCENGLGAIGLPMTPDHWGSRATKAMHPKTLELVATLASLVFNAPFEIENLGLFSTKGELAKSFYAYSAFTQAAKHTASCDRSTYSRLNESCGICSSCILRRIAIDTQVLRLGDDHSLLTSSASQDETWSIDYAAMKYQVATLREVINLGLGFEGLENEFPQLFEVKMLAPNFGLSIEETEVKLTHLIETYINEFDVDLAHFKYLQPMWLSTMLQPGLGALDAQAS